jgi:hypothetical protein
LCHRCHKKEFELKVTRVIAGANQLVQTHGFHKKNKSIKGRDREQGKKRKEGSVNNVGY